MVKWGCIAKTHDIRGGELMLSKILSAGLTGIDSYLISVEVNLQSALPYFELVGLPDAAIKEAKERVRTACENSGIPFPGGRILVNLAPACMRKEGSALDTAIIIGILSSAGMLRHDVTFDDKCFLGELSLSGELRSIRGVLSCTLAARDAGLKELYVPAENALEASVVEGVQVYPVQNLRQLIDHLNGRCVISPLPYRKHEINAQQDYPADFSDVKGQEMAKRALEIAAAGGHNILLIGPPGSGKSMLAKRLPSILPPLSFEEAIQTTKVHSVSGTLPKDTAILTCRPYRSPHHTMSVASLVGGGSNPLPGEVSLAHNGVLFLDELPEFPKQVTDTLRQPIEEGEVTVTRVNGRSTFPCSFMLVAAMNPCRCGYFGDPSGRCTCHINDVRRYISRISGPILDRIDIQIEVPALSFDALAENQTPAESSAVIRERVCAARSFAQERMVASNYTPKHPIYCNAQLSATDIRNLCPITPGAKELLRVAYDTLGLSARGYDRTLRVARTIADLAGSNIIDDTHIAEAIQLRSLDRKYWYE